MNNLAHRADVLTGIVACCHFYPTLEHLNGGKWWCFYRISSDRGCFEAYASASTKECAIGRAAIKAGCRCNRISKG